MTWDIESYLANYVPDIQYANATWRVCDCLICGKEGHFHFNIETTQCGCFKCGYTGNYITLVSEVEGIPRREVFKSHTRSSIPYEEKVKREKKKAKNQSELEKYYDSLQKFYNKLYLIGPRSKALSYLTKRGFDLEKVNTYGIRRAPKEPIKIFGEKKKYTGRIIIPYYRNGKIVYYQARAYGKRKPKTLNPPKVCEGAGKTNCVFNIDNVEMHSIIIITEGSFDVMAINKNAVAIGGKFISKSQLGEILSKKPEEVVVMLDADAHAETINLAHIFSEFVRSSYVLLDKGDPGDRTEQENRELIKNRITFDYTEAKIKGLLDTKRPKKGNR